MKYNHSLILASMLCGISLSNAYADSSVVAAPNDQSVRCQTGDILYHEANNALTCNNNVTATPTGALMVGSTLTVNGNVYSGGDVGIGTNQPQAALDMGNKTSAIILPQGTTQDEPSAPVAGMIRFNQVLRMFEGYDGTAWHTFTVGPAIK